MYDKIEEALKTIVIKMISAILPKQYATVRVEDGSVWIDMGSRQYFNRQNIDYIYSLKQTQIEDEYNFQFELINQSEKHMNKNKFMVNRIMHILEKFTVSLPRYPEHPFIRFTKNDKILYSVVHYPLISSKKVYVSPKFFENLAKKGKDKLTEEWEQYKKQIAFKEKKKEICLICKQNLKNAKFIIRGSEKGKPVVMHQKCGEEWVKKNSQSYIIQKPNLQEDLD